MTYLKDNNATTRHVFWRSKRAQKKEEKSRTGGGREEWNKVGCNFTAYNYQKICAVNNENTGLYNKTLYLTAIPLRFA